MTLKRHAKDSFLKQTEETNSHNLERACKRLVPQNYEETSRMTLKEHVKGSFSNQLRKQADMIPKGHAKGSQKRQTDMTSKGHAKGSFLKTMNVVIPIFRSSMYATKACVHQSESDLLLTAMSEKEDLTRKHLKKGKKEKKRRR